MKEGRREITSFVVLNRGIDAQRERQLSLSWVRTSEKETERDTEKLTDTVKEAERPVKRAREGER